jgi:nickel-type superoxide dismutase maturation protease
MKVWPIMIRRVQGHSMVPVLPPGTLVLGWRWFTRLQPGRVIIFSRENRETIKRLDRVEPGGLFVLGDHPETSTDSRHYGTIPRGSVESIVIWPRTSMVQAEEPQLPDSPDK